jgi:hypothetical protein
LPGSEEILPVHLAEALHAHLHCNTPALAGGARERSAAQVSQSAEVDAGVEENWFASSESGKINKVKIPLTEVYR